MGKELKVILHKVVEDGLPDMEKLLGRVAFVFDGKIVSGWPLDDEGYPFEWEAHEKIGKRGRFAGVEYWLEFPEAIWTLAPHECPFSNISPLSDEELPLAIVGWMTEQRKKVSQP